MIDFNASTLFTAIPQHGQKTSVQVCSSLSDRGAMFNAETVAVGETRKVEATLSPSAVPTARDVLPRTRRSKDSQFETW